MKLFFEKIHTKKQAHDIIKFSNIVFAIYIVLNLIRHILHQNYYNGIISFIIEVAVIFFLQKYHSRIAACVLFYVWPFLYIFWYWRELFEDPFHVLISLTFLYLALRSFQAAYKYHSGAIIDQNETDEMV